MSRRKRASAPSIAQQLEMRSVIDPLPDDLDEAQVRELVARGVLRPLAGEVQADSSAVERLRERIVRREERARRRARRTR